MDVQYHLSEHELKHFTYIYENKSEHDDIIIVIIEKLNIMINPANTYDVKNIIEFCDVSKELSDIYNIFNKESELLTLELNKITDHEIYMNQVNSIEQLYKQMTYIIALKTFISSINYNIYLLYTK